MELKKVHEDKRGSIWVIKDFLGPGKEYSILEIKKGAARGGCLHSKDEYYSIIKGKVKVMMGNKEWEALAGESGKFPAGVPHVFIGLEDSIISEWGITTEEKTLNKKDPEMLKIVDEANQKNL